MNKTDVKKAIEQTAERLTRLGVRVELSHVYNYVGVSDNSGNNLYYSQGESVGGLLADAEQTAGQFDTPEPAAVLYLLASSGVFDTFERARGWELVE